jgi:hypothetical protein
LDVKVDSEAAARDPDNYAVSVTTVKNGKEESIRTKYALVRSSTIIEQAG